MIEKIKTKKAGITLVSLIITIIVLLILAGITINLTIGEDGIIKKAQEAGKNMVLAQEKENEELNKLYSSLQIATNDNSQITISIQDLNKLIDEKVEAKSEQIKQDLGRASAISYDNTESKLGATNVQDSIDELNSNINTLSTNLNNIVFLAASYSKTQKLPVGSSTISVSAPSISGYTALAMISAQSNTTGDVWITHSSSGACRVYNNSGVEREDFSIGTSWIMIKNEFRQ